MQDEKTKNSARGDVSYLQSQQLRKWGKSSASAQSYLGKQWFPSYPELPSESLSQKDQTKPLNNFTYRTKNPSLNNS